MKSNLYVIMSDKAYAYDMWDVGDISCHFEREAIGNTVLIKADLLHDDPAEVGKLIRFAAKYSCDSDPIWGRFSDKEIHLAQFADGGVKPITIS